MERKGFGGILLLGREVRDLFLSVTFEFSMMSTILQSAMFPDSAVVLVCVSFDNDGEDSKSSQYCWAGEQDGAFHCNNALADRIGLV